MIFSIILKAIDIMELLILVRVLLSWIPNLARTTFGEIIYKVTEPLLAPIRKFVPSNSPIDFSPILLFVVFYFFKRFLWILFR